MHPRADRTGWPEEDRGDTANGRKADEEQFRVPSLVQEAQRIQDVYAAIRNLVPQAIWTKLMAQREEFERDYQE